MATLYELMSTFSLSHNLYHMADSTLDNQRSETLEPIALLPRGFCNFYEAGYISTGHETRKLPVHRCDVLLRSGQAVLETVLHDVFEFFIHFFGRPST